MNRAPAVVEAVAEGDDRGGGDGRAEDSHGKGDIYVAFATRAGEWSTPVNLGDRVNSEHSESCPSLSADGKYLFFSRYDEPDDVSDIYWIDSAVIERVEEGPPEGR